MHTGQFIEFTNNGAYHLCYNCDVISNYVRGETVSNINFGKGLLQVTYQDVPYLVPYFKFEF